MLTQLQTNPSGHAAKRCAEEQAKFGSRGWGTLSGPSAAHCRNKFVPAPQKATGGRPPSYLHHRRRCRSPPNGRQLVICLCSWDAAMVFILGLTGGGFRCGARNLRCWALDLICCRLPKPAAARPFFRPLPPCKLACLGASHHHLASATAAGMAMGKSTVAQWLRDLGVPVLDSDQVGGGAVTCCRSFAPDWAVQRASCKGCKAWQDRVQHSDHAFRSLATGCARLV